jgi:hypothetical protein
VSTRSVVFLGCSDGVHTSSLLVLVSFLPAFLPQSRGLLIGLDLFARRSQRDQVLSYEEATDARLSAGRNRPTSTIGCRMRRC